MPRFELFPESCLEWSGAERYAESMVASSMVERQASLDDKPTRGEHEIGQQVVACIALAAYLAAHAGLTRSLGLQRAVDLTADGRGLGVVQRAQALLEAGSLSSGARAAVERLQHYTVGSDRAATMVMGAVAVVIGASADRGLDEATEPVEVRELGADGESRLVARRPDELVMFDTSGWSEPKHLHAGSTVWRLPSGVGVHIGIRIPGASAIPPNATDLDDLREAYRGELRPGVDIVDLDVVALPGGSGVREVMRVPLEADELVAFQGEVTIPFEAFALVVRASATAPVTVAAARDADDVAKDSAFPTHPLTLVRQTLDGIQASMTLHESLGRDEAWLPVLVAG